MFYSFVRSLIYRLALRWARPLGGSAVALPLSVELVRGTGGEVLSRRWLRLSGFMLTGVSWP